MEEMNDKLQVLLIEDNANYANAIRQVLDSVWDTPFELEWADHLSTGLELLAVGGVDAILLDLVLPDSQGFETFATVHARAPDVPIIVMSGLGDEALAVRAVRAGAQDYLVKEQVDIDVLVRAIRYAIERKRAEEALRRYADEQAALYAVTSAAASFLDPDELLATTLDVVLPALHADAGWATLPDPTLDDPPRIAAWRGLPEAFVAAEESLPLHGCPVCTPLLTGDDAQIELALLDECPRLPKGTLANAGLHSYVGIPLSAGDRVRGVLHIAWRAPDPDRELERGLLTAIGQQIGVALRNAQLYQAARQVDHLQALNAISTAAVSSLELDTVLHQVLELTCQALDAERGSILLREPDTGELVFGQTIAEATGALRDQRLAPGQGIAGWVAEHGQSMCVNDVRQNPRWYDGVDVATGLETRSLVCAPLIYHEAVTGVLEIVNKRRGEFTGEDVSLLEAVSSIATAALENARLFTATRERAEENARLYDELKGALHEQEKMQTQLIHAEKMSALGRLTASIAHEINNPLQGIQGHMELAIEGVRKGQKLEFAEECMSIAVAEIDRIASIVHRMREFYRPAQAGMQSADLHAILETVLRLCGKQLQHSTVTVEREWGPDISLVWANAGQLKQVFLNLVLNAIDTMPGGGTLRVCTMTDQIRTLDSPESQPAVRIEFSDTGQGMSPEMLNRIFEPFLTTKTDGTGLGLSISHSIIEAHQGRITVSSQVGEGTTFTVLLPVEQG